MFVEPFAELFVHQLLNVAFDVAVQLAFGLPFELRLRQAHADHGDQPFAHIVARDADFVFLFLKHPGIGSEVVDGTRERGAETGKMRAAVHRVDGVRERKNIFTVGVVVLQRNFYLHAALLAFHVDGRIVERCLPAIDVLDEFRNPTGEAELRILLGTLIVQRDLQTLVQESIFAQASGQRVIAVNGLLKNRWVSMERNSRSGFAGLAGLFQLGSGFAFFVRLLPHSAIALNFKFEPIGKRVYNRDTHSVQTARHLVGIAVELAPGMQHRQHDFCRRTLFRRVHVHRNAAPVVHHRNRVVFVHGHVYFIGVARHRFIN